MKRSEIKKKHSKQNRKFTISFAFVCVAVVAIILLSLLNANMNTDGIVDTEIAKRYTYEENITAASDIVRKETLLSYDGSKVLYYTVQDGDIVSAGSEVALVFANETDALNYNRINEINKQIKILEELNTSYENINTDFSAVDKQIELNLKNMISAVNSNSTVQINTCADNLVYSINQRQVITGAVSGFSEQIALLREEARACQQQGGTYIDSITTDVGGYFVASADGYEGLIDYNTVTELTVDDMKKLNPTTVSDNTIGKIVSGLNWYVVCKLSADDALTLSHSNVYPTLTFPNTTCTDIPADLASLNQASKQSDAVAVFRCNYMNTPISHLRNETVQITVNTYTGLRISKAALHDDFVEKAGSESGERQKVQGVYVKHGNQLDFKEVSILYAGADFVIVDEQPAEGILVSGETLKLNDEVVIRGEDLFEGKDVQ
ncbi:MAG: hypothetical protein IJ298_04600 [Ruminococcus sp.]|nr:hypothetical protein [Ruminococcus sp.]